MGTALSMNSLAEAVGMSLTGCAAIPAPYRDRGWMAYNTGGAPAVLKVLLETGKLHGDVMTVTGKTMAENLRDVPEPDHEVIRSERRNAWRAPILKSQTPWEEIYRKTTGQHGYGACMEFATEYQDIIVQRGEARDNH